MSKRPSGLGVKSTKNLTYVLETDHPSGATTETEQITYETLLRTRVQSSIAWDANPTGTLSFASIEQINLAINPLIIGVTGTITLSNIPADSEVFLKITKGAGLTIAFASANVDYFNSTLTTLYFRIISIGSSLFVINIQKHALGIDNLTTFTPTLSTHPATMGYADNPTSSSLTLTGTPDANNTDVSLYLTKKGGTIVVEGTITATNAFGIGDAKYVGTIPGYISPSHSINFFAVDTRNIDTYICGRGFVDTDGKIYFAPGVSGGTWIINFPINQ
jgi:hypothetical protein